MRYPILLPLAMAVTAIACSAGQQQPASTTSQTPQRGGTFQFAASRAPDTLSYYEAVSIDATGTLGPVYETLLEYAYQPGVNWQIDFPLAPGLAQSWEQVDPTTYVFHLQDGVHWHDGEALTADDIAFSYETIRDPPGQGCRGLRARHGGTAGRICHPQHRHPEPGR